MYIKAILIVLCLVELISAAEYLKRADYEDPRMFSSAYGKRSAGFERSGNIEYDQPPQNYLALRVRRNNFEDPRLLSMSFGKRSVIDRIGEYVINKRADIYDPRFYSGSFGRK